MICVILDNIRNGGKCEDNRQDRQFEDTISRKNSHIKAVEAVAVTGY